MKIRSIYAIATVLVLTAAINVPSAAAQSMDVKARITFEFYAAGKLFPAGTYTLSKASPDVLRLDDSNGRVALIATGRHELATPENRNWIIFNRYGERSFLAGAYWEGSSVSLRVPPSREEKEVAKHKGQSSLSIAAR